MPNPKSHTVVAAELLRLSGAAEANGEQSAADTLRIAADMLTAAPDAGPPPEAIAVAACRNALASGVGVFLSRQSAAEVAVFLGRSHFAGMESDLGGIYCPQLPLNVAAFLPDTTPCKTPVPL